MARLSGLPSCHDVAQTTELIVVVGVLLFCGNSGAVLLGDKAGRKFGHFDIFEVPVRCKCMQGIIKNETARKMMQRSKSLPLQTIVLSHVR